MSSAKVVGGFLHSLCHSIDPCVQPYENQPMACDYDAFARVAKGAPPGQVFPVSFLGPLLAEGQLLRAIRPPVGAGEVVVEGFFKVEPAVNTPRLLVVQPDSGWAF